MRYVVLFYCVAVETLMISGIPLRKWLTLTERKRKTTGKGKLESAMPCFSWRHTGVLTGLVTKARRNKKQKSSEVNWATE